LILKCTSIGTMTGLCARILSHTPRCVQRHVGNGDLASNLAQRRDLASARRLDTPSSRHVPCPRWYQGLSALH